MRAPSDVFHASELTLWISLPVRHYVGGRKGNTGKERVPDMKDAGNQRPAEWRQNVSVASLESWIMVDMSNNSSDLRAWTNR